MSYSTGAEVSRKRNEPYTLQQALAKIYLIKGYTMSIPQALFGKRVRLVIVDNEA